MGNWLQEQVRTYAANATATRDYRVQMRGSRAFIVFGLYTGLLVLIAVMMYYQTAGNANTTIVTAQYSLQSFFRVCMSMLAAAICLITPALSATAIVAEAKRQSLDLIFSAPVEPKYYLVGKAISAYRYTWMLLALSLPVIATCVVLGGATWLDVLYAFVLLSAHALVFTAIGLLFSAVAPNFNSAIGYTYATILVYLFFSSAAGAASIFMPGMSGLEKPFGLALNPFTVIDAAPSYTTILGTQVPNWIIGVAVCLLATKYILSLVGAVLSPPNTSAIAVSRIHGLIVTALIFVFTGYTNSMMFTSARESAFGMFWTSLIFAPVAMIATPYGFDMQRRLWPNGGFRIRDALNGKPAGALPYLLSLLLVGGITYAIGAQIGGRFNLESWLVTTYFTVGFWVLVWGVGRYAASFFHGIRSARTLMFTFGVFVFLAPLPLLNSIARTETMQIVPSLWDLYLLMPMIPGNADRTVNALIVGTLTLLGGVVLYVVSESQVRLKLGGVVDPAPKKVGSG